jgi:uncharacterized protein YxjI
MKKILVMILTAAMIAAALIGCSDKPEKLPSDGFGLTSEDTNGNWLRDDVELKILKYKYGNEVDPKKCAVKYFGTYNNMLVLNVRMLGTMLPDSLEHEIIAGNKFSYGIGREYRVWVDEKLYYLKDAYELGILTDDDVKYIHQRHAASIYLYGPYNEAIVYQRWNSGRSPDTVNHETIAGVDFQFPDCLWIQVIYDDKLYGLREAYESGILTDEDVKAFYDDYSNICYLDRS